MPIIYSITPEGEEICIIFVNFLKINNAVKNIGQGIPSRSKTLINSTYKIA